MPEYYRVVCENIGITEAVKRDCERGNPARLEKPDGSWLPRLGNRYPGAISLWTKDGMDKYYQSGLLEWQASVVKGQVYVVVIDRPGKVLYRDDYQIICDPLSILPKKKILLGDFILELIASF
jgi:hypothetical protein